MAYFQPKMSPEETFRERWPKVEVVVKRFLNSEPVPPPEWHQIFQDLYNISLWDQTLNVRIQACLTETIREYILKVQQELMSSQDESSLLRAYVVHWKQFEERIGSLCSAFRCLHSVSGQQKSGDQKGKNAPESPVKKIMLDAWDTCIYEVLQQKLLDSAVRLIQDDRCGQLIDPSLVSWIGESCVILSNAQSNKEQKYLPQLEQAYIRGTKSFYRSRIVQFVQERGIRNYAEYAVQKLNEEEARGRRYLETVTNLDSLSKLMDACVQLFVVDYMDQLLAEVPKLLREEDLVSLRRFYDLIRRGPDGLHALLPMFEHYIKQTGLEDIRANAETMLKDADKYVCRLLELYSRFSHVVSEAFNNHPLVLSSRDKAFQEIVNNTSVLSTDVSASASTGNRSMESRCPELLATYCDLLLRKSPTNRRMTPDEIEKQLKNALLVLKYVNSKDVFMRVYKSHLMRRLLLETSADNEMEEMMVNRLRDLGIPAEQVNKLARMFQDIKISHDFTVAFKETYRSSSNTSATGGSLACNLNVDIVHILILCSGSWLLKSTQKVAICLPSELEDLLPMVEDSYRQKHHGRNLVWQHHLSHGIVLFIGEQGRFELELTTYQIVVLYAWNRRFDQHLTLDSLLTATGLQEAGLRRTLWSLCAHPKMDQQIILYSPEVKSEKEFTENTQFWLNLNFSTARTGRAQARRRFNLIGRLQLTQEPLNEDESMAIAELRQLRAQEGIIKLLKTRKRMHHNDLYKELVDLLRFQFVPSKRLIKEVLDWLLERQYIRRDESDMNVFVYVT